MDNNLTVLQVCNFISKCPGNFIFLLEKLEKKIKDNGGKMIYVFPEPAKQYDWCQQIQKRTIVYFVPYKNCIKNIETYKILKKIFKNNNIDIVHSHHDMYDFPVTLIAPKNVKIYLHLHNAIGENYWNNKGIIRKIKYFFGQKIYKRTHLISVSEYYKNIACKKRFDENKSIVLDNGICLERLDISKEFSKEFEFLTFASDFYGKGGDIVIDACSKLEKKGYRFKLLFCGGGRDTGWSEFEKYLNQAEVESIEKCEVVDDVRELYNKCRVFISASRKETFSQSVCEAVYSGMQVISSDIPGLEWAKKVPTVKFFAQLNADELANKMEECIENVDGYDEKKIKKSKKIIEENYSDDIWVNKLFDIYRG